MFLTPGWPRQLLASPCFKLLIVAICGLSLPELVGAQKQLPYTNGGPDSEFSQMDFAQMYNAEEAWLETNITGAGTSDPMIGSGVVSVLDMEAPRKAVQEMNRALPLLKAQHTKEAIPYLQKAVRLYPQFVSAHNALGLAYLDQQDVRAKSEFQTAAQLDGDFACSFINLGMLALRENDFAIAEKNLEKAAFISPKDATILAALAFAENGDHKYAETLKTVERVHAMKHRGLARVHYIGASAAMSLRDFARMQRELTTFLSEDPTNPLAPIARNDLAVLNGHRDTKTQAQAQANSGPASASKTTTQTFPNTQRLEEQLDSMKDVPDIGACELCAPSPDEELLTSNSFPGPWGGAAENMSGLFTIRKAVDETALFFSVNQRGQKVEDLTASDIQILDNDKPPEKVLEFIPQSELPVRLGFLIDASGSVSDRFSFEKRAAEKFLERLINPASDLAFVAGFSEDTVVTQDFTGDPLLLANGIEKLNNDQGGTSLFDAIYFACWKLAAYPDSDRVAKILVVLTDGQDNSSHRSLRQTIEEAEASGVTIYTLSTAEYVTGFTDADKILKMIAERSGGESIFPVNLHGLDHRLDKLSDAIRRRYLIAYRPANFAPDGSYRTVKIRVKKDGKNLQVHARSGYYTRAAAKE